MEFWRGWLHGVLSGSSFGVPRRRRYARLIAAMVCANLCGGLVLASSPQAQAALTVAVTPGRRKTGRYTGLPVPRFGSLRSGRVDLRRGPGKRYPIEWILLRRSLPVEILREFQDWRYLRIPDGTQGWVHRALLWGRRTFITVVNPMTALRRAPQPNARVAALLKRGVIGRLVSCGQHSAWCEAEVAGHDGYLKRSAIWGVLPGEVISN